MRTGAGWQPHLLPICSAFHFSRPFAHPPDLLRYEYELFSGRVAAASSESLVSGELEERGRQAGRLKVLPGSGTMWCLLTTCTAACHGKWLCCRMRLAPKLQR